MTVYIDKNYKCHAEPAEGLTALETDFFDGKCKRFIESYRYIPTGKFWVREYGEVFWGEMITPHEDYAIPAAVQEQYEESQQAINEYEAALSEIEAALGV